MKKILFVTMLFFNVSMVYMFIQVLFMSGNNIPIMVGIGMIDIIETWVMVSLLYE